jgi:TolB-like protein
MRKLSIKKRKNRLFHWIVLIAQLSVLIGIGGCAQDSKYFVRPQTEISTMKKLVVLPFENFTSDAYAGEKIRMIVISELLTRGIDVVEPGEVTRLLKELQVRSLNSMGVKEIQEIGKTLNVEAVMRGSVEAFGVSRGISVSYPEVTINLMLIDTSSGNIIWSVRHTSGGASFWSRHFGAEGISLSEAARRVVREAIDTTF